ncbi:SCO family protein [Oceanimonas sp. CHS3-5]|uniref:SCO family protein n=1 Tax=Oceanimonas sp. CHS3-5 TaxID=3068186 RepID=UPI00273F2105|nr:SCO family protein [Oceanimonas sp. CHS3-5]MDP5291601.1 SCO family protein [Oceanimonas sp. CHS3-5]
MMKRLTWLLMLLSLNVLASLPGDSLYQLDDTWQNHHEKTVTMASLTGKKQLLAFIYTDCATACPVLVSDLKRIQQALTPAQQQRLGFVLVSLTPGVDTPKVMAHFAGKRKLDEHWTLLSGDDGQVRTLAMALNIKYTGLANGEIAHSNAITALDDQGRILFQQSGLPGGPEAVIEKMGL